MELLVIAIWVLFGIWGASVAKKRGRNQVLGAILTVIFGIFAIFFYMIIGKTDAKAQEDFNAMQDAYALSKKKSKK